MSDAGTTILIYLLTYSLHAAESFLKKLTGSQLVKKFPALYGSWRFITAFATTCHLSAPTRVLKWCMVMGLGEFVTLFILIFLKNVK
jgi:hypothetical protein